MTTNEGIVMFVSIIALVIFLALLGGSIAIWCVNTLFTLGIAYTAKNIIAAALLLGLLKASTDTTTK